MTEKVRGLGLTGHQVLLRTTVAAHGQHEHGRVASSDIRIRQGDDQDVTQGRDEHRNSDMQSALLELGRRNRDSQRCEEREEIRRGRQKQRLVAVVPKRFDNRRELNAMANVSWRTRKLRT